MDHRADAVCLLPAYADEALIALFREARSASIPCSGKLWELQVNVIKPSHGNLLLYRLQLECVTNADNAKWIILSEVRCDKVDPYNLTHDFCEREIGAAFGRFVHNEDGDRTHIYNLGRFLFAKDCARKTIPLKYRDAATGKTGSGDYHVVGWLCSEIGYSDGLSTTLSKTKAANWKYSIFKTFGTPSTEDEQEGGPPSIFGSELFMYQFRIEMHDGNVTWGEQ